MNGITKILLTAILMLVCAAGTIHAQDRPVVFLHGLNSDGASWAATAARLQTELAIAPRRPEFGSFQRYEDQANAVQNQLAALPGSTVAVGHSNGGVVARQWARAHDLSGIITIGTPHLGAPLVTNLSSYLNYAYSLSDATNQIAVSFGTPLCVQYGDLYFYCDLNSVGNIVGPALALVDSWHWQALAGVITRLGIDANAPVLSEMRPGSSFLNSLNGQAGREAAEVAVRVGIVSTAHHFSLGGPLRVVYPGQAGDNAAAARDYTALLLRVWAGFIYSGGDYGTSERAQDLADKMMSLSGFLSSMDRRWCYAVSAPNGNVCIENDSVVPVTSQDYASLGAQRIWNGDGPTHFEENDAAGYNNVYEALVNYTHIPQRSTPPPPPPPPPPASPMVADSAVRGCSNYHENSPQYQPSASACYAFCQSAGADSCEWYAGNGDCYVEAGQNCHVEGGYGGWYAAVLSAGTSPPPSPNRGGPMTSGSAVRGCAGYREQGPTYMPDSDSCSAYCARQGANACEWEEGSGGCFAEWGNGCFVDQGYGGWWAAVYSAPHESFTALPAALYSSPTASPKVTWSIPGQGHGTPAIGGGSAFFLTADHRVVAVDSLSGRLRWATRTTQEAGPTQGSVVKLAGNVVVAGDSDVIGLNRQTGAMLWVFRPPEGYGPGLYIGDSDSRTILAGSPAGRVYSIDAASGRANWTASVSDADQSTAFEPVAFDDQVFCNYVTYSPPIRGGLIALDRASGREIWRTVFGSRDGPPNSLRPAGGPAVSPSRVFIATADGVVHELRKSDGRVMRTLPPLSVAGRPWQPDFRAMALSGSTLVVGSQSGVIQGLDVDRQLASLWRINPEAGSVRFRIAIDDGLAYISTFSGTLMSVSVATGREQWRAGGYEERFDWLPAVEGGIVYVATTRALGRLEPRPKARDGWST